METNVGRMEGELKTWGARLDTLIANVDWGSTAAKIDYRERLDDLRAKYWAAEGKFAELKAAGSNWETFRSGVENAWGELEAAFRRVAN